MKAKSKEYSGLNTEDLRMQSGRKGIMYAEKMECFDAICNLLLQLSLETGSEERASLTGQL